MNGPWTDQPARPGFYYFRHPNRDPRHVWVAQVSLTRASGLFASVYSDIRGDAISHVSVSKIAGTWCGPLPWPWEVKP